MTNAHIIYTQEMLFVVMARVIAMLPIYYGERKTRVQTRERKREYTQTYVLYMVFSVL